MRKVLIVDDEKWVRKGLIQSIAWDRFGLELAGEAADGREGYELARRIKPDILFLDMRMPGVDGKELIGMLNRDMPGMMTIVVSGYSDFEYTKEAIRNKAFEYLLKPVKKEELTQVLERALHELASREATRRRAADSYRTDWLRRTLFPFDADEAVRTDGEVSSAEWRLPAWWQTGECLIVSGQTDEHRHAGEHGRLAALLEERLRAEKPFLLGGEWDCIATTAPGEAGELIVAVAAVRLDDAAAVRLAAILQQTCNRAAEPGVSFGISRVRPSGELPRAYAEARSALKRKPVEAGRVVLTQASDAYAAACASYPSEQETALLLALRVGNPESALLQFDRWFQEIAAAGRTVDFMQRGAIMLVHAIEKQLQAGETRLEQVCGKHPTHFTDALERRNDPASVRLLLERELLPPLLAHYSQSGEKLGEQIVREVRKWVDAHYDQPLSMLQIAGMHYMNPDYLSRLFKRMTGSSFIDYLTDVRIGKAKAFMKTGAYKNYEIARMAGYEDYRYFSQIFKKKTGMTIGEYRRRQADRPDSKES